MKHFVAAILFVMLLIAQPITHGEQPSLADLEQEAFNAATAKVAPSVVRIRTVGGLDRLGKTLLSQGPTTGLIVSEDGYIVSSAFNFASKPTSILVRLADGKQLAAELVARDMNRMLVLLKVESDTPLPVPQASTDAHVGQWAVALGRTFEADRAGVSVGIVSALHRMYGRVLQTDASISVANYGGPLVDIEGRVLGVLVPMSPQASVAGENELAGAEFYDSGIGFAVPLPHVLEILDRWKQGADLLPGKLGIGLKNGDAHFTVPEIVSVWPKSPAAQAGWQPQDRIIAVDGVPVATQAQLRFQIVPRYAGDALNVTLRRGEEELDSQVTLTGKLAPYRHAFLGILPARESSPDEPAGAPVRRVWPDSPAATAGVETGDLIIKIGDADVATTGEARAALAGMHPDDDVELIIKRGEEERTLSAILATLPEEIIPPPAAAEDAPIQDTIEETKLEKLLLPEFAQEAVYLAPTSAAQQQMGLLLWLGDGDDERNQALADAWQVTCHRDGLILLIAPPATTGSWKSDDLAYLDQLALAATRKFSVDRNRLVVAGHGKAGQLAYALAFKSRNNFSGAIGIDAPLPRTLKLPATSPSNRLATLSVESQNSNFAPLIRGDVKQLREQGYPTTWLERPATSDITKALDEQTRASVARWIDGLDRY